MVKYRDRHEVKKSYSKILKSKFRHIYFIIAVALEVHHEYYIAFHFPSALS